MATQPILITGVAGFVGAALATRLLAQGTAVVGVDILNDYYPPALKQQRLANLAAAAQASGGAFTFHKLNLTDEPALTELVLATQPSTLVHLAAQAGVRYSLQNPAAYLHSNLIGHQHVLQACRAAQQAGHPVAHLLYASSSSVYGNQTKTPFSEADALEPPASLYAATKQANEQCTHAWSRQFGQPATGMRFFTVYGPWGRPDMTPMLFGAKILQGEPIPLFNGGDLWRDFTFIDDIVEAITRLLPLPPAGGPQQVPHQVYNLGNQSPVQMRMFVEALAAALGRPAVIDAQGWPTTEVYQTFADTTKLQAATGLAPHTPLASGLAQFASWFLPWHAAQTA